MHEKSPSAGRINLFLFCSQLVACGYNSDWSHAFVRIIFPTWTRIQDRCKKAHPKEIVKRWHQLFQPKDVSRKFLDGEHLDNHEQYQLDILIDTWQSRLHDISWFMKVLNENITRRANKEDKCTGHFWESRYKSQALLDEKAVLSAMAYVDLNPIRAAMATTPETSEHTSIKLRIDYWKNKANQDNPDLHNGMQPKSLLPFAGNPREPMPLGLAFNLIPRFIPFYNACPC